MINTTRSPFTAPTLGSRETEVSEPNRSSTVPAKDVFRFEVPMKDTERVAMRNCSCKLRENLGDETCSSQIDLSVQDKSK